MPQISPTKVSASAVAGAHIVLGWMLAMTALACGHKDILHEHLAGSEGCKSIFYKGTGQGFEWTAVCGGLQCNGNIVIYGSRRSHSILVRRDKSCNEIYN